VEPGIKFCATCGAPLVDLAAARRGASGPSQAGAMIALVLLDDLGSPVQRFERRTPDTTIGRLDGDIRFPEDVFLSPLHAKVSWEQDTLVVRDLGSRNGTWVFLEGAHRLVDGDLLLIGSGSGETESLCAVGRKAKALGGILAVVTIVPFSTLGQLAEVLVRVDAPSPKAAAQAGAQRRRSVQPMGALFEQTMLLLLDAVVMRLAAARGTSPDELFARHANLE